MVEPIRVFVGTEPKQWLASEVLRYSIAKRTKAPIEFKELKHLPLKLDVPMRTGFSIYRFAIPEMCQYKGRAIYLDADIVVLSDLQELLNLDMQGKGALARAINLSDLASGRYTSVMLLDCEKLTHWKLSQWVEKMNQDVQVYNDTLWVRSKGLVNSDFGNLPENYNHLDKVDTNTKILHYTNLQTQPWHFPGHPFANIFLRELKEAIAEDEIPLDAILREIQFGHIYPNILVDLKSVEI